MNTSTDMEMLEKLSIQIASENPCATREEIMDLVAEAVEERINKKFTAFSPESTTKKVFRAGFEKTLEAQSSPEKTDG